MHIIPRARRIAIISGALSLVMICSAHVGSPDAFFEGKAGAYPVRVIVRSPAVIPARAEIIVRVTGSGVTGVNATTRAWGADERSAPPPDDATRVPGDSTLWTLQLWVMRQGSYAVLIHVDGTAGSGTAIMPYTAVAQRVLAMNRTMAIVLSIVGIFLIAGMLTIVRAAAGEATLMPGVAPSDALRAHARRVRAGGAVLIVVILVGGKIWWNFEDSAYAAAVFRPTAATVAVRDDSTRPVRKTRAGRDETRSRVLRFTVDLHDAQRPWIPLIPDHGKLMHLILVKKDGLGALAHLHPIATDSITFQSALPALPAGSYFVFADVVHENGFAETLVQSLTLTAAPQLEWHRSDNDDALYVGAGGGNVARFDDGSTLSFDGASAKRVAGADAGLRFTLRDAHGAAMSVEPYMGMAAHAIVVRSDGSVFVHLHPTGTGPGIGVMGSMGAELPGSFEFPWAFPREGQYRVWVQFRTGGAIRTAAFDVVVAAAK